MVNTIYKLDPVCNIDDKNPNICRVYLTFNGQRYCGAAVCSPKDADFFSQKIGFNIALSRARIKILEDMTNQAKLIAQVKRQMLFEAAQFGKVAYAIVDPTGAFFTKVTKAHNTYKKLKNALKKERKYLRDYLVDVDKTIERIKINRSRAKTNN